ncbi:MAG: AmmeMemoRadiSam system protein B [Chloroflexi bacterium]|nr:AmmeMemoRadiSam system protein B [Chloroflexota bacterium]
MTTVFTSDYPKLRPLDMRPHTQAGQSYILLRDPTQLSDKNLLVPQFLAAALVYCDGAHDLQAIGRAFERQHGVMLPADLLTELLAALDEALMLENARTAAMRTHTLAAYRQAPFRPPALAGQAYPAEVGALQRLFQRYLDEVVEEERTGASTLVTEARGLLSPHIDYRRGGPVYAQVWKRAAALVKQADVVIMFGTDHYGSDPFTLTRQNYATPYGVLPTAQWVIDALIDVIGEEAAFAGELRHRGEHSLELVATWLHHMRDGAPCAFVPILCGGFHSFIRNGQAPAADHLINCVIEALGVTTQQQRVAVIASGDLAHVGPAFGGRPLDQTGRTRLRAADDTLIEEMCYGRADGFFEAIRSVQDRNNVCGVAPIYLTMRLLAATHGECTGYATCPADEHDTSVVTVGGVLFG